MRRGAVGATCLARPHGSMEEDTTELDEEIRRDLEALVGIRAPAGPRGPRAAHGFEPACGQERTVMSSHGWAWRRRVHLASDGALAQRSQGALDLCPAVDGKGRQAGEPVVSHA